MPVSGPMVNDNARLMATASVRFKDRRGPELNATLRRYSMPRNTNNSVNHIPSVVELSLGMYLPITGECITILSFTLNGMRLDFISAIPSIVQVKKAPSGDDNLYV
jgi:hypothetical protein